jgi:enoyl-CoA hydratase
MSDDVLFEIRGGAGIITLNRPQALNALNRGMCNSMRAQLSAWEKDAQVKVVILRGAGERAFCAGGDVVGLYHAGKSGSADWENFFWDEYQLDYQIATYAKPIVSLCQGVTMGGGVGIGLHIARKVAAENFMFAMPETGIGLIPDVGGTHLLARLPGAIGIYLGLTGARVKAADALAIGLVSHIVPHDQFETFIEKIAANPAGLDSYLGEFSVSPGAATLTEQQEQIDQYFSSGSLQEILAALSMGDDWAIGVRDTLMKLSPTSMKLSLEGIRRAKTLDLAACLAQEYNIVCNIKSGTDFFEGIRALLIDKDKKPIWKPAAFGDVTPEMIAGYFEPPQDRIWSPQA